MVSIGPLHLDATLVWETSRAVCTYCRGDTSQILPSMESSRWLLLEEAMVGGAEVRPLVVRDPYSILMAVCCASRPLISAVRANVAERQIFFPLYKRTGAANRDRVPSRTVARERGVPTHGAPRIHCEPTRKAAIDKEVLELVGPVHPLPFLALAALATAPLRLEHNNAQGIVRAELTTEVGDHLISHRAVSTSLCGELTGPPS